jgi:hypothetical protein
MLTLQKVGDVGKLRPLNNESIVEQPIKHPSMLGSNAGDQAERGQAYPFDR